MYLKRIRNVRNVNKLRLQRPEGNEMQKGSHMRIVLHLSDKKCVDRKIGYEN